MSCPSPEVDLVALFVVVDCHRAIGIDFVQEFGIHIIYPLFLKRGNNGRRLHSVESFLVDYKCDTQWDIICSAFLFRLVYDVDVDYR